MSQQPYDDPFAVAERHPSLSFKDKPIGTRYSGKVTQAPALVQSRDFETGERATWDDGNPKMSVVTSIVDANGEEWSVWAAKPSAMFAAMAQAQQDAGARIAPGGQLVIEYVGDKPNEKNPRLNPAKQYRVTYEPPSAYDAAPASGGSVASAAGGAPQDSEPPF